MSWTAGDRVKKIIYLFCNEVNLRNKITWNGETVITLEAQCLNLEQIIKLYWKEIKQFRVCPVYFANSSFSDRRMRRQSCL